MPTRSIKRVPLSLSSPEFFSFFFGSSHSHWDVMIFHFNFFKIYFCFIAPCTNKLPLKLEGSIELSETQVTGSLNHLMLVLGTESRSFLRTSKYTFLHSCLSSPVIIILIGISLVIISDTEYFFIFIDIVTSLQ